MFVLTCKITIGNLVFRGATEVEINTSWKNLTQTAKITMPKNIVIRDKQLKDIIRSGNQVIIELGYDGKNRVEFTGYVARLSPQIPFVVEVEDNMWKLKQTNLVKSYSSVNLKNLLADLAPEFQSNVADAELGSFRINKTSAAKVLQKVKDTYGLSAFFQGGVLNVGLSYPGSPETVKYHFQQNVISNDLQYRMKEDTIIKVKAISMHPDNTKTEIELGDSEGEVHTLTYFNLSGSELKNRAEMEMSKLKVDGYRGSFLAWGLPYVQHGNLVQIVDEEYPEREGKYFVDAVQTTWGMGGFRRKIELGGRAL